MTLNQLGAAVFALGLAFAATASAAPVSEAALARIVERGREMQRLDQAAWCSTDEMMVKLRDPRAAGVAGWIVEPHGDQMRSTYYGFKDGRAVAIFIADTQGKAVITSRVVATPEEARLTDLQLRMIAARKVAVEQPSMRCTSGPMNSIVIPPITPDEPIEVYVLSSQVKTGEVPFGGHQRFRIDAQGKIVDQRQFTSGCANMPSAPPGDAKEAALVITHILDTTPTELHVFSAQAAGAPVYVVAPDTLPPGDTFRVWLVEAEAITLVQDVKP